NDDCGTATTAARRLKLFPEKGGDPVQRDDGLRGAELDGGPGHSEDGRAGLVLRDGEPAGPANGEKTRGAVGSHPGQQHAPGPRAATLRRGGEEGVDRWNMRLPRLRRPLREPERVAGSDEHAVAAAGHHVDPARL